MPKTRTTSVHTVKDAYIAAKNASIDTAALVTRCTAAMIEEHATARLHPEMGADALALMTEATQHALRARECILRAHPMLKSIPGELGITINYGADETFPDTPGSTQPSGHLRSVA